MIIYLNLYFMKHRLIDSIADMSVAIIIVQSGI